MQKEVFKDIPNYEGKYQISNLGRVKSLKRIVVYPDKRKDRVQDERILKTGLSSKRYLSVSLWKNGKPRTKLIHVLIAEAFLNHKPCGMKLVVDHINAIKTDNRLDNLQLITNRENLIKDK
jgi:hypothetical protein